jgi:hypothetical protein
VRDYAKVSPQFWIGETGKRLRKAGQEAQVVAMYLVTSPHANMIGLYYLPRLFIQHETGLSEKGASKGLAGAIEAEFCEYDDATEMVWVRHMAAYQVGESLSPDDKRCKGIQKEYDLLPENPFLGLFFDHYEAPFNLTSRRSPSEGACKGLLQLRKPLRSQEQEQEREQEKAAAFDPSLVGGLNPEAWRLWVEHRKAIKKPLKSHSLPVAAEELAKLGGNQLAEVKRAVAGGWQGLHPDDKKSPPKGDRFANAV